jgi:hypothetical protein
MEAAASAVTLKSGRCRTPGCDAPTQRCIEGLSLEECPNFLVGSESTDIPTEVERNVDAEAIATVGRGGEALSVAEADACMLAAPVGRRLGVVALVGVPESGKTTLLSSLYECVRRGLAPDLCFAGSETIRGFEERCHLSRLASMRSSPDTPHTAMQLRMLHLGILLQCPAERVELFMADRRGEQFQDLLDRPNSLGRFPEVKRGHSVAFLLDGDHLVDGGKREGAISKIQRLAMALNQLGDQPGAVQLVVTKTDKIQGHANESHIRSRVDAVSAKLERMFDDGVRYTLHFVAARKLEDPTNGLSALLSEWLAPQRIVVKSTIKPPLGKNAFERLMNF